MRLWLLNIISVVLNTLNLQKFYRTVHPMGKFIFDQWNNSNCNFYSNDTFILEYSRYMTSLNLPVALVCCLVVPGTSWPRHCWSMYGGGGARWRRWSAEFDHHSTDDWSTSTRQILSVKFDYTIYCILKNCHVVNEDNPTVNTRVFCHHWPH